MAQQVELVVVELVETILLHHGQQGQMAQQILVVVQVELVVLQELQVNLQAILVDQVL
jgi:hypothetical protein